MPSNNYPLAIAIFLAALVSSIIINSAITTVYTQNRVVSVKGLSERKVKADLAIWGFTINNSGDDLNEITKKNDLDVAKTITFLKANGLEDKDINLGVMKVFDRSAQQYYDENNKAKKFIVSYLITAKTENVDAVYKAYHNSNDLVKQGVIFAYDGYNNGNNVPRYSFTKLNSIKPEMLSEATAEAKKAANEFALNSGSEIGKIKSANQGVFTVFSQEEASGDKMLSMASNAGSQYGDEGFYLEKMVRVVISVDYYLKN